MFKNSVGRWMMLALAIALAAWGASYTLPGVQLAAQNEKLVLPESDRSVKSFGAKGDGVSDDAAVIQKAVDGKARTIRFPAGIYRISKTIEVDLDQVGWTAFVGDGTARIVMAGPGPAIRFIGTHEGTADPASFKENVWEKQRLPRVSGLEIVGSHPEADGIEASGTMQITVDSTLLRELRHGVRLVKRNRNVLISACHIYHNRGVGVYLDHVNLHQTNIVGSHISYNGGGGVVVRGGEVRNVHITGCDIEANMDPAGEPTANVLFDSSEGSMAEGAIVGCTIQHARLTPNKKSANIRILGKGVFGLKSGGLRPPLAKQQQEVNCGHITIGDNVLSDIQTNIHLAGARGVTITGNTFWQGYAHNLLVEDSSQIVLGANLMERNPMYGYTDEAKNNVLFKNCRDCTISGLQLHNVQDSDAGLTLTDCRRMHVSGNTILDCDKTGMLLTNLSDSRVADNMIRDDRGGSIPLKAVGGRGNWFTGNMWTGQPNIEPSAGAVQNNFAAQVERTGEK